MNQPNMLAFTQSCLDELRTRNNYLSDIILEFYFNYLATVYPSDSIMFVSPTISFMIANSRDPDATKECLTSLELTSKDVVFFPVNNRGIHWSLLVFFRKKDVFVHHDSMNGLNNCAAHGLFRAVKGHVKKPVVPMPMMRKRRFQYWEDDVADDFVFEVAWTPQQTNGYDCGLYVMALAKIICHWFCDDNPDKDDDWQDEVEQFCMDLKVEGTLRPRLLRLIEEASRGRLGSVSCTIEEAQQNELVLIDYEDDDSVSDSDSDDDDCTAKKPNDEEGGMVVVRPASWPGKKENCGEKPPEGYSDTDSWTTVGSSGTNDISATNDEGDAHIEEEEGDAGYISTLQALPLVDSCSLKGEEAPTRIGWHMKLDD